MKKAFTFLLAVGAISLFSFKSQDYIDESIYSSKYIKYSVVRDGSDAVVQVELDNIKQYEEIYLRRSDAPSSEYRQVKYLTKSQISELASSKIILDKYPLPGNIDAYYKVVAVSDKGVYKLFPSIKLSRY